jgi:toxin-antitoxin system PIN domain toxin
LIYAINEAAPQHEGARDWLQRTMSGTEPIGLPWAVVIGFVRVSTHPRILTRPLSLERATELVDGWFAQPSVQVVEPTGRHWQIVKELLEPLPTVGNLASDAHLAALAIDHGARLFSTDADFDLFEGLRWTNPLAPAGRAGERRATWSAGTRRSARARSWASR